MELLNNREVSLLLWTAIFLVWVLRQDTMRDGLHSLFITAFEKPLRKIYGSMLIYILLTIYILQELGLWEASFSQVKATFLWTLFVAILAVFRASRLLEDPHYFKNTVRDNISLIVALEFVLTFYTFNLIGELILVPVSAFLGGLLAVAERDEKHEIVARLINGIFIVFGTFVLGYAGYNLVADFAEFASLETLVGFYTPPLLSLLFLPYVYLLSVYMMYERVFLRIGYSSASPEILKYAKWRSFLAFHLRARDLDRWATTTVYNRLDSKADVKGSIKSIKELIEYEKNPRTVLPEEGWSPYEAMTYLEAEGLKMGHYHSLGDGEWFSQSDHLDLSGDFMPNYATYYISGDRYIVKSLKLKLYVHKPDCEEVVPKFIELAEALLSASLGEEVSTNLDVFIAEGTEAEVAHDTKKVILSKEIWPIGEHGQYDIALAITTH